MENDGIAADNELGNPPTCHAIISTRLSPLFFRPEKLFLMYNLMERPKRVTLFAFVAFFFAAWNALRLGEAIYLWKTLIEYGAHPWYIAITGAAWCMIGSFLVWGLWKGKFWAWLGAIITVVLYVAWYWLDRFFLQTPHANIQYSIFATSVLVLFFFFILFTPRTVRFFRRAHHGR